MSEQADQQPVLVSLQNVDWGMLRAQKDLLYEAIAIFNDDSRNDLVEALEGINNLIDHIQDQASTIIGSLAVYGIDGEDQKPINAP